jgi:hypothetical protein
MDPVFIDDGYTKDGHVAAKPGLHGALSFTFRPALPEERLQFAQAKDQDGRAYGKRAAQALDRHIIGWDAADGRGNPVEKNQHNLLRLHPTLFVALLEQVMGYEPAEAAADAKN